MARLSQRLESDEQFAEAYRAAHVDYLDRRAALAAAAGVGEVPEIETVSAGGMPGRVKCLHALAAHALAAGPGVNPVGDVALAELTARGMWDTATPCVARTVAAIDCGTNSIRMLIASAVGQDLTDVTRRLTIVRLGEGLEQTGRISDAALSRVFAACDDYSAALRSADVGVVRFVATSASRDAANAAEFIDGVTSRIGVTPEVITGDEEARLSFVGAIASPAVASSAAEPRLVVDIGGGSTEFVLGTDAPQAARSVDVGCVRLAERHLHSDPPTAAELAAVIADADAGIARAAQVVPIGQARSLVGLAGTVTTVAAVWLGLDRYDPGLIHGTVMPAAEVHRIAADLSRQTLAERLAMPLMLPGRADVIVAGALIWSRIVAAAGVAEVVVSEHDILDGVAAELVSFS